MAEKDMTEKTLEAYNDVFADIVNVLLFDGKRVVRPNALQDATTFSQYKFADELHEQERDVAKYWKKGNIRLALCGLENQTKIDKDMVLRVMGYDGAVYRGQLLEGKNKRYRYPVVTLVLYFGSKHWTNNKTLLERVKVPKGLEPYVNDYKINVVEVAYLSMEQIEKFRSDFKDVAKFFVAQRTRADIKFSSRQIKHVDEVLKLLQAATGEPDNSELFVKDFEKGEKTVMGNLFKRYENKGLRQGRKEGREEGIAEGRAEERGNVAVEMIKEKTPISMIQKFTKLSLEQLQKLSKECGVALVM